MYELLTYFTLNFAGFFFFLYVWNRIPKPRPFDYTTIPGMKLNYAVADDLPPLSYSPGTPMTIAEHKGHITEITEFPCFDQFLEFCRLTYGPLASFYWGPRYCVVIADIAMLAILKESRKNLLAICPLAVGSILLGEASQWTNIAYSSIRVTKSAEKFDEKLSRSYQDEICRQGPPEKEPSTKDFLATIDDVHENLGQVRLHYERETADGQLREAFSRPLVVVFNKEIDVDAHPVPANIPFILHMGAIISPWSDSELFSCLVEHFSWLPSFSDLSEFHLAQASR